MITIWYIITLVKNVDEKDRKSTYFIEISKTGYAGTRLERDSYNYSINS